MTTYGEALSGDEGPELPEFDLPPADPVELLQAWVDHAVAVGVREPLAVGLATADAAGRPSNRTLLVKEVSARGLIFTTDAGSAKGADLRDRPYAAMLFYWRETLQQVRVCGPVQQLADEESDRLFAERPVDARATTAASAQSRPLDGDDALLARAEALRTAGAEISRPDDYHGYLLTPEEIEFWHGRRDRLHKRLRYRRDAGGWTAQRLQP